MACRITEWVIDCSDPAALAAFWAPALGYTTGEEDGDGESVELVPPAALGPSAPTLLLLRVPEPKAVKNRVHLDVNPTDRSRDEEVQRLLGLGARRVDVGQGPEDVGDTSWVVLADPEGNEFCVLSTTVSPSGEADARQGGEVGAGGEGGAGGATQPDDEVTAASPASPASPARSADPSGQGR